MKTLYIITAIICFWEFVWIQYLMERVVTVRYCLISAFGALIPFGNVVFAAVAFDILVWYAIDTNWFNFKRFLDKPIFGEKYD